MMQQQHPNQSLTFSSFWRKSTLLVTVEVFLLLLLLPGIIDAFALSKQTRFNKNPTATTSCSLTQKTTTTTKALAKTTTALSSSSGGNIMDSISNFFGGGGADSNKSDDDNNNNDPSAPKRILDIPVNSLKEGGLRFALGLFLIGKQNSPIHKTWRANQADDGVLDMYYLGGGDDASGMFSVSFTDTNIAIDRYGPQPPSLQYQLRESLILHELLDELHTLAFEGNPEDDIKDENRLLTLPPTADGKPNAIDKARAKLPARKA